MTRDIGQRSSQIVSVGGAIQDGGSWWTEDGLGRFIETGDSVGRRVLCLVMTVVLKGERGGVVQSGPLVVAQGGGGAWGSGRGGQSVGAGRGSVSPK